MITKGQIIESILNEKATIDLTYLNQYGFLFIYTSVKLLLL